LEDVQWIGQMMGLQGPAYFSYQQYFKQTEFGIRPAHFVTIVVSKYDSETENRIRNQRK